MKRIAVFLTLLGALLLVSAVGAQGSLNYDSGFQVQNLSDTDPAAIVIRFYNKDGTVDDQVNDTVQPGRNKTYFPISASPGFDGSVVVSSDQPVAAIVNVVANNFAYGASYSGFESGAEQLSLPLIMKENSGFSTWFNVQNAGSSSVDVDVSYAGTSCTDAATIEPGAAATFDQASDSCLPSGYVGAASVDAPGGSVVATVMEVGPTTLFAYSGFTGGSQDVIMPLVNANNSGFISGIQIQNRGGTDTDVTVAFEPSLEGGSPVGTACEETKTVPAGGSATFGLYAMSLANDPDPGTDDCVHGERFVGSASVSANSAGQPLVGIVNQLNQGTSKGSAYSAFDPAQASGEIVLPLIMDRNSGYFTGINVVNIGSTASAIDCTYTSEDGSVSKTFTSPSLSNGESFNHLQLNFLADGFVGSGVCTAKTAGAEILGQVNELGSSATADQLFTYEAFNN